MAIETASRQENSQPKDVEGDTNGESKYPTNIVLNIQKDCATNGIGRVERVSIPIEENRLMIWLMELIRSLIRW